MTKKKELTPIELATLRYLAKRRHVTKLDKAKNADCKPLTDKVSSINKTLMAATKALIYERQESARDLIIDSDAKLVSLKSQLKAKRAPHNENASYHRKMATHIIGTVIPTAFTNAGHEITEDDSVYPEEEYQLPS